MMIPSQPAAPTSDSGERTISSTRGSLIQPLSETIKREVLNALDVCEWDPLKAAKLLGIGKSQIYRRLKRYRAQAGIEKTQRSEPVRSGK